MGENALLQLALKGAISQLDEKDKKQIKIAYESLKLVVDNHGDMGILALMELAADIAVEDKFGVTKR